jgi:hypothetical protein
MAKTPVSELLETITLVRTMKETIDSLVDVVEKPGNRVVRLEQKIADDAGSHCE